MGVDAQMLVRVPRKVTPSELRRWSYLFGSMAHHWLFIGYDEKVYHKPLERTKKYQQDGDDVRPSDGETLLEVHLRGRYYGPGYECGDLLAYVGIAEFLEALIPGCSIWYGGDSSGICAEPFGKAQRAEFLAHAAENGHDPYKANFDSLRESDDRPECPVCAVDMTQYGFGNQYALYRCSGCGWEVQRRNGVTRAGFSISDKPEPVTA